MSTDLGLFPPRTKRPHRAGRTKRLARHATAAPVGSQKMARERPLPLRKYVSQLVVDLVRVLGARQPQPLRDPEHVRVHRDGLLTERVAENDVRGLETHSGSEVSASRDFGTSPPCVSTSALAIPMIERVFDRKKPVERISCSNVSGAARA